MTLDICEQDTSGIELKRWWGGGVDIDVIWKFIWKVTKGCCKSSRLSQLCKEVLEQNTGCCGCMSVYMYIAAVVACERTLYTYLRKKCILSV